MPAATNSKQDWSEEKSAMMPKASKYRLSSPSASTKATEINNDHRWCLCHFLLILPPPLPSLPPAPISSSSMCLLQVATCHLLHLYVLFPNTAPSFHLHHPRAVGRQTAYLCSYLKCIPRTQPSSSVIRNHSVHQRLMRVGFQRLSYIL